MTTVIKEEDLKDKEVPPSETEEQKKVGDENEAKGLNRDGSAKEQDPLKIELEKVKKGGRTKKEKLIYTKKRIEEQLSELDEDGGANTDNDEDDDDDKPLTKGEFKKMQQQNATKSALQLAEDIENETERELAKWHLQNTIRSTGNPKEDLRLAMNQVNAVKNSKILEELGRKGKPKPNSTQSSAPGTFTGDQDEELTADEAAFMKPPFNMTKEQILKTRTKS